MSLVRFSNTFPTLFNNFLNNDNFDWLDKNMAYSNMTTPSVNIKETEERFEVELAAPGLSKEDFKIELNNNILTVSSEKRTENETKENDCYTRHEFSYQSFSRSFTLPQTINGEQIEASYKNGILVVNLPKKEESKVKPIRQISIS